MREYVITISGSHGTKFMGMFGTKIKCDVMYKVI